MLISFKNKSVVTLIKNVLCVLTFCFIFNGMMIAIYQIFKPQNMAIVNDTVYFQVNPLLLISISVIIYIVINIISRLLNNRLSNTLVSLQIKLCDKTINCTGKIDTACSITEPFSNAPVIIIEKRLLKNIMIDKPRIVPYNALGSTGILTAIKAQSVKINEQDIDKDIYVCLFDKKIDDTFSAIINSQIIR